MEMNRSNNLLKAFAPVIVAGMLYGCGGGAALPTRKKMPEFSSYDGFESAVPFSSHSNEVNHSSFAFATSNVDLMLNGNMQGFVAVALPTAANDSAAVSLVNTIKPFAMPMLTAWALQQRHGVMIDLSSHTGSEIHRSDYLLQKQGDFSIPVVVIWDGMSAARLGVLKGIVQDMPAVTLSCTSGNDPSVNFMGK
jgi:hypothetical protein